MAANQKYQKFTHHEHVLKLPDTYVGSTEKTTEEIWYFDKTSGRMKKGNVSFVPGEFKIFDEIVVNAIDQYTRTRESSDSKTIRVRNIQVTYSRETGEITVFNDGDGIPVEKYNGEDIYIPELIFGNLLTSSNYTEGEKKHVGGKNGYGAKLANIFSREFKVETIDFNLKKSFSIKFTDNMTKREAPVINSCKSKPYTKISYIPDYTRLGGQTGLSEDMIKIIEKRTYDMAACTDDKTSVFLNGEKIEYKNFERYTQMYIGDKTETPRVYESPNDRWEVVASLNPFVNFEHVSFVNGINTYRGGKHVDYIVNQICKRVAAMIKKKKKIDVKTVFIRENLMVFVKATIDNPSFNSQTKENLTTNAGKFGSKCELSDKFMEGILKCGIMEKALALNQLKDQKDLHKTDGKKQTKLRGIPKLEDANWAGTAKSAECCLILTEGDSAKTMAMTGIGIIGRDRYGVFPLKGKLMNVRDIKNIKKLQENDEINNIKKIIGLQAGKEYSSISELRYGSVMVLTDQDEDGSHIKGLLFNVFQTLWPTLFSRPGFLLGMLTPIVKAKKGKESIDFYSLKDFNAWNETNGKGYTTKYYKGLGTSTPTEAKEYFKNLKTVVYKGDNDEARLAIDLAFGKAKDSANHRKDWLKGYDANSTLDYNKKQIGVHDFVHRDLIHFSNSDNIRSIASGIDGFKPSQRKVLFGCLKRKLTSEIRVAQLAGYISEHCAYHHGEASLQKTIIKMAQNFVGANNIELLEPIGQFGSRILGGEDSAQPRYIHTHLSSNVEKLFNPLDENIYEYNYDDTLRVEPKYYVPLLPMILVNGCNGIGTGWSSDIPQYNPVDISANIRLYLKNPEAELNPLTPFYRGFKGTITKINDTHFISRGIFEKTKKNQIRVTELPVGLWTEKFKEHIEGLIFDTKATPAKIKKQFIRNYTSYSTDTVIDFYIDIEQSRIDDMTAKSDENGVTELENALNLASKINTTNMNYYNRHNQISNTSDPNVILREFCEVKLETNARRREYQISVLESAIGNLEVKIRFIRDFISGKIQIASKKKADIEAQLTALGYPVSEREGDYMYLLRMPMYNLTLEKTVEFSEKMEDMEAELEEIRKTTPNVMWREELNIFSPRKVKIVKKK